MALRGQIAARVTGVVQSSAGVRIEGAPLTFEFK